MLFLFPLTHRIKSEVSYEEISRNRKPIDIKVGELPGVIYYW